MPSSAEPIPPTLVIERAGLRDVPRAGGWMSDGERAAASAFRVETRRRSWILGRWTAKRAAMRLADAAPDADPRRWSIVAAEDGAPEIVWDGIVQADSLSLSHRSGRAIAVAARHPAVVGCDLERIEPRSAGFVDDFLVESERAFVRSGSDADLRANLVWSAKEAALKVGRTGLRRDTRRVVATFGEVSDTGTWCPFSVLDTESGCTIPGWWRVDDGFVETIAVRLPASR